MSGLTFVDVTPEPEDVTPPQELPTLTEWPEGEPLPPTVEVADHPCVTISCSTCHDSYNGDDVTLHFDTVAEAIKAAIDSDWVLLEDGAILCMNCADLERCRRFGHGNIRTVDSWTTAGGYEYDGYTICDRCGHRPSRDSVDPAAPKATS